jgi:glyoxylase-like metal-dependent hydrolase (beta-lactamase superfamily II)
MNSNQTSDPTARQLTRPSEKSMPGVHAIRTGFVQVRKAQQQSKGKGLARIANMLVDPEWTEWLPIYAWAIEHEEGVILVDTGETSRVHQQGYFPGWHPFYRRATHFSVHADEEIGTQLRNLGISPRDVRQVVLTHLHTDHAGGLKDLTSARSWVSEQEFKRASGFGGRIQGYLPHRWPRWWEPSFIRFDGGAFGPFGQSMSLTKSGDVLIVPTPGHTPHHVSVVVRGSPTLFIAGDTSYSQELLIAGKSDGVSPSEDVAKTTLAKIAALARERPLVYLPSHDPQSEERLLNRSVLAIEKAGLC